MNIVLIHSRQPANQYAGGGTGVNDSENYWMYKLMLQVAAILRGWGFEVDTPDNSDYNRSGSLDYADNVAFVNDRRSRHYAAGFSFHSNAMGDACILYGTSTASRVLAENLRRELDGLKYLPFGDTHEFNTRKVSETTKTYCPFVLIEVGRHDTVEYANWLRVNIENGFLPMQLALGICKALDRIPGGETPATPSEPEVVPPTAPAMPTPPDFPLDNGCHTHGTNAYFGPQYPLSNKRSVSGVYSHSEDLKVWQRRMAERGWKIQATGVYDRQTEKVLRAFQREKFGHDDGALGRNSWDAAWTEPVT